MDVISLKHRDMATAAEAVKEFYGKKEVNIRWLHDHCADLAAGEKLVMDQLEKKLKAPASHACDAEEYSEELDVSFHSPSTPNTKRITVAGASGRRQRQYSAYAEHCADAFRHEHHSAARLGRSQ